MANLSNREESNQSLSRWLQVSLGVLILCTMFGGCRVRPLRVSFAHSATTIEAYDFVEVTASVSWPHAKNPFVGATLKGWFETADGSVRWPVDGFCDSESGSVYRIRFMPSAAGDYRYFVEYRQDGGRSSAEGTFRASEGHFRGPIRVDSHYPWHFVLGGDGRALLLQWDHCILAGRLVRRKDNPV